MRLSLLTMCLAAAMLFAPSQASAISILWVTENSDGANAPSPDDVGWTDFLVANGHVVTRVDNRVLDAPKIAAMEAADLVIVSRDTNSGNYTQGSEVADWNGITTPMILMNQFLTRSSRWKWLNTGGVPGNGDGTISVVDASHPVFAGMGLSNGDDVDVSNNNTPAGGTGVGNGLLLATDDDNANPTIAFWSAGTEFYAGAGQTAGGDRLFLGMGNDDNNPKGAFGLTADGEQLFLNAVNELGGSIPEPATVGLVGLAAAGLVMRRRRNV